MKTNKYPPRIWTARSIVDLAGWCLVCVVCLAALFAHWDGSVSLSAIALMTVASRILLADEQSPKQAHGLHTVVDQGPKLSGADVAVEAAKQHVQAVHADVTGGKTGQPHTALAIEDVATDRAFKHLDIDRIRSLIALFEQAVALDNPEVCYQLGLTLRYHAQQLTAHAKTHERFYDWYLSSPPHLTPGQLQLRQAVDAVIDNSR